MDFLLTSPISLNNFTYEKVIVKIYECFDDNYEWLKKRLTDWKENKKPLIAKKAILSTKSWLSVKDSNILYIVDNDKIKGLDKEYKVEVIFKREITNWKKLPYKKKIKFIERWPKESCEDMKKPLKTLKMVMITTMVISQNPNKKIRQITKKELIKN